MLSCLLWTPHWLGNQCLWGRKNVQNEQQKRKCCSSIFMIFEEKNALAFHSSAPWKFERPLSAQYKTHISRRPRCSARKGLEHKGEKGKTQGLCSFILNLMLIFLINHIYFRDSWIRVLNDFNLEHALNRLMLTPVKLKYHFMSLHFTVAKPCQDCYTANIWKQKTSSAFVGRTNRNTL